jgi:hypothetical protein
MNRPTNDINHFVLGVGKASIFLTRKLEVTAKKFGHKILMSICGVDENWIAWWWRIGKNYCTIVVFFM